MRPFRVVNLVPYASNKWLSALRGSPIARAGWGRFECVRERGEYIVSDILQEYAANDAKRNANEQKIGDYYSSCMGERVIEQAGTRPLCSDLKSIAHLKSKDAI